MSIDEIKMLDVTERIILVEEIWDSTAKDQESVGLSEYEKEVLDTRLIALENNSDTLMLWNEIRSRISV